MPGGVVSAARSVRRESFVICLVEVDRIALVPGVTCDDLGAFRNPDDAIKCAGCGQKIKIAAQRDAIRSAAIDGVEGVNHFCFLVMLQFERERSEFVSRQIRGDTAEGRGGDRLRVAAPGVVTGVYPALKRFGFGAIVGEIKDDAVFFWLNVSNTYVHGGSTESPEEQAEGDAQDCGEDFGEVCVWKLLGACVHDVLLCRSNAERLKRRSLQSPCRGWRGARRWVGRGPWRKD